MSIISYYNIDCSTINTHSQNAIKMPSFLGTESTRITHGLMLSRMYTFDINSSTFLQNSFVFVGLL
jgi:hypothetical protein